MNNICFLKCVTLRNVVFDHQGHHKVTNHIKDYDIVEVHASGCMVITMKLY